MFEGMFRKSVPAEKVQPQDDAVADTDAMIARVMAEGPTVAKKEENVVPDGPDELLHEATTDERMEERAEDYKQEHGGVL